MSASRKWIRIPILAFIVICVYLIILFFAPVKSNDPAEAAGTTESTVFSNFNFYNGSSYYFRANLLLTNGYDSNYNNYINTNALSFRFTYGSENFSAGMRTGCTITVTLTRTDGAQYTNSVYCETDYGCDDGWSQGGSVTVSGVADGIYSINISGTSWRSGNSSQYSINMTSDYTYVVDTSNPTLSCGIGNGGYTNQAFTVSVSDTSFNYLYYKTPGDSSYTSSLSSYKNVNAGSRNGWYYFYAIDRTGHKSDTYSVYYDSINPTISFSLGNVTYTNQPFTATVTENGSGISALYLQTPGASSYTYLGAISSKSITAGSANGWYRFYARDYAGNQSGTYSIFYDNTKPLLTSAVADNGYTNAAFSVAVTENGSGISALYWKEPGNTSYSSLGAVLSKTIAAGSANGWYYFYVIDNAGNQSDTYSVNYDTVFPVLTCRTYGGGYFYDGGYINLTAYFNATESSPYTFSFYKRIGETYTLMDKWTNYQISTIYFDKREMNFSGKTYSYNVYYTQTAAEAYISAKEESRLLKKSNWTTYVTGTIISSESAYANTGADYWTYTTTEGDTYIFFDEARAKTYIASNASNYVQYSTTNYFWEEGEFKVKITDAAGNFVERHFISDFTAPVGTLINVNGNGHTASDFSFTSADETAINYIEYLLPGTSEWITVNDSNITIQSTAGNGTYKFRAYDKAGNVSAEINAVLDTVNPQITLNSYFGAGQTVSLTVTEGNFDYITLKQGNSVIYTGALRTWAANDLSECTYILTAYDKAGNSTSKSFTVDKTAPAFTVNGFYKGGQTVSIAITEVNFDYAALDGSALSVISNAASIPVNSLSEGQHTVIVYDKAGYSTSKSFTVDKTAPAFSVNAFYRAGQTVSVTITEINLDRVTLDGINQNTKRSWSADSDLTEGQHTIVAYDKAGNSTSKSFTVDKTPPAFAVEVFYRQYDSVIINITETNLDRVTLDGTVTALTTIPAESLSEGQHTIIAYDKAGNSTSKSFTVDKTAPAFSLSEFYRAGQTVSLSVTETNLDYVTFDGATTALRSWSANDISEGSHEIAAYDKAGNYTAKTFIIDKTSPAFTTEAFYRAGQTISFSITEANFDYITLKQSSNTLYTGAVRSWAVNDLSEGTYVLTVYDKAGNSALRSFTIDKTVPSFSVNSYYKNGLTVSITVVETNLDYVAFDGDKVTEYSWRTENLSEGTHNISVCDLAGNITTKSFIVDKTAPAFSLNAFYRAGRSINLSITEVNLDYVTFDSLLTALRSWTADGLSEGTHTIVAYDKAGNSTSASFIIDKTAPDFSVNAYYRANQTIALNIVEVNLNTISVSGIGITAAQEFAAGEFDNGTYTVSVTDKAGNSTSKSFTIDKIAPEFSINAYYKAEQTISFSITETNLDYIKLDEERITNTEISASELSDGTHTITVYDKAGNYKARNCIVDKTAPVFTLKEFYAANETISLVIDEPNLDRVTMDGSVVALRSWDASNLAEGGHTVVVYDKAGNSTEVMFYFKTAAPILSVKKNGATASSGVYLKASDSIEIVINDDQFDYLTLNGIKVNDLNDLGNYNWTKEWTAAALSEGTHNVTIFDKAKNETTIYFTVDKTLPTLVFKLNGAAVSGSVFIKASDSISFTYSDLNIDRVILDGETVTTTQYSASALTEHGHNITVYDKAGNEAAVNFNIDKTLPVFTLEEYYSAADIILIAVTDINIDYVTLDNNIITLTEISAGTLTEAKHTVIAYDKAGNSTSKSFTVDKTAPAFTLNGYYNANSTISLDVTEKNKDYVTLDNIVTSLTAWQGSVFSDGTHTVTVYDKAGNFTSKSFIIDKTAPEIEVLRNNIASVNAHFCSTDVLTLSIFDDNFDYLNLNSTRIMVFELTAADLSEGTYILTAADKAGNTSKFTFTVDKTLPAFTLKEFYNASSIIMLSIVEKNLDHVTLDGSVTAVTSWQGTELPEGQHTIVAYDKAGNSLSATFVIDATAPLITVLKNGTAIAAGAYLTNSELNFIITDENLNTVTLDDATMSEFTFNMAQLTDGTHVVKATDKSGNISNFEFTVDKTAPVFTLKDYYNASAVIMLSVVETNLDRVTLDGSVTAVTSWQGAELPEGQHTVAAYDKAGNSLSAAFVIDTTVPLVTVLKNGTAETSQTIYITANDSVLIDILEANFDALKINGEITQERNWEANSLSNGTYILTALDKAGNITSRTVIVDKTAPIIALRKNGQTVETGAYFKEGTTVSVIVSDSNIDRVALDDVLTEKTSWSAGELYEGKHILVAYDKAGNYKSIEFIVNKTAPAFTLEAFYKAEQSFIISENSDTNIDTVSLTKAGASIYSGAAKTFSTNELSEGTYVLTVYDKAGNLTSKSFVIDKTAPVIALNAFYKAADSVKVTITEANLSYFTLDGETTQTTVFNAANFEDGTHTVSVYDKAGNSTSKTFIIDKTAPVLPLAVYYKADQTVWIEIKEANLDYYTLDGAVTAETSILSNALSNGRHTVVVYDKAGNYTTVNFTVDKTAPVFTLKEFYKESDTLFLGVSEENLSYVTLDEMTTEITVWQCTQLSAGTHTIVVYDKAGNSTSRTFVVDKTAPVITLSIDGEISDSSYYKAGIIIGIGISEEYLNYVTLNGNVITSLELYTDNLSDGNYSLRVYDKAGNVTAVSFIIDKTAPTLILRRNMKQIASSGVYITSFDTMSVVIADTNIDHTDFDGVATIVYSWVGSSLSDGTHTVTVYDKAGNFTTVSFIVHKSAPEFTLKQYYVLGDVVTLDISDEAIDYVTLDSALTFVKSWNAVELGQGTHTIKVVDKAGNSTSKSFVVDTIAPNLTLMKNSMSAPDGVFMKAGDTASVTVSDANLDYVTFDGEKTDSRSWEAVKLDERKHTVIVYDKAGNNVSVTFTVDKTAPAFTVAPYYLTGDTVFIDITETYLDSVFMNGSRVFNSAYSADALGEGTYILTASDKAGNTTVKSFTVDLTAPVVTVSGINNKNNAIVLAQGQNSYGAVTVTATDIAAFTIYSRFGSGGFIARGTSFTVEKTAVNEGTWEFYAADGNGYVSATVSITVDFTAPVVTVGNADADEAVKGYTNTAFTIGVLDRFPDLLYYKNEAQAEFSLCSQAAFDVSATDENQGKWSFYSVDKNGLVSAVREVTLDLGCPVFALNGLQTETASKGYTNTSFTYTALDRHFASVTYKKTGATVTVSNQNAIVIENTKENEGTWEFYAEDSFGQRTSTYSVVLSFSFDFLNIENVRNSFKQNTRYTVTLPAKIYGATTRPDISGTYTFASYDTALAFAMAKEREYRVYTVNGGGWGYVSVSNENVYITYQTEAELSAAVTNYAKKYVSARKMFSYIETRNEYVNITNEAFKSDVTALTVNSISLPDYLSEYNLPVYLARQSFVPANNAALTTSSVKLTYIGNLTGAVDKLAFGLIYGESLSAAMSRAGNLYEGYYLYEESDLCGNIQRAIFFIDLSLPEINAEIVRGDGSEKLKITKDTVGDRSGVFYALSFNLTALLDNMDSDYLSVFISSDTFSGTYTKGDVLPVLNSELGAGTYTVIVYDRSYNLLTFSVIIGGTAPSWYYTSLSASTKKLSVYINKNDNNNAIISLRLVKIRSDGSYIDLTEDDEGTPVTPATTAYALKNGGKYTVIIVDIYGRTVEMTSIFYEKGLPSGILSGVVAGGATNTAVSFSYGSTYGFKAYYLNGSVRVPVLGITPVYNAETKTYSVTLNNAENTTTDYLLLLYLLSDEGIYIEYTFTIDCEAPLYSITAGGLPVAPNGSTNKAFKVEWGEANVTVRCQRSGFAAKSYESGTIIELNALYTFSLKDKVGNEAAFTVYLDSEVSYTLSQSCQTLEDGSLLSNMAQKITVTEEYTDFSVKGDDGAVYGINDTLAKDGKYNVFIADKFGNSVNVLLVLDFTAPVLTLSNVKNGLSNQTVTFACNDPTAVITRLAANGSVLETLSAGAKFADEGSYIIRAADPAGNINTYTFTIDKHIDYTCTAENGLITTSNVSFVFSEKITQTAKRDGEEIVAENRYTVAGCYEISITDAAGNAADITFTILSARLKTLITELPEGFVVTAITSGGKAVSEEAQSIALTESGAYEVTLYNAASKKNYYFSVEIDNTPPELVITEKTGKVSFSGLTKKNVTATLYRNGAVVEDWNTNTTVSEKGNYVLVLTDDVGNTTTYEFAVKLTLNTFSIILIAFGSALFILVLVLIIKGRRFKAA